MAHAIVLAAGVGSRMNSSTPKQFLELNGKEVVCYSLDIFQNSEYIEDITLVTGEEHIEYCISNIVRKYNYTKVKAIVAGGAERYNSVYNGLQAVCKLAYDTDVLADLSNILDIKKEINDKDIVMIHDGARPFITIGMIEESIQKIKQGFSGCTVGVPVKDTIKIVEQKNGETIGAQTPDRNRLYQVQTPQTFDIRILIRAYEKMLKDENHKITDDTMLLEQYMGAPCAIVSGAYDNIKLTTPEDLLIGEIFAKKI